MSLLRIDFSAVESLITDFDIKLYTLPRAVQIKMIKVAAEYVCKEIKKNARSMTHGEYSLPEADSKTIANSTFIDDRHLGDYIPYAEINFKGTVSRYNEPRSSHPRRKRGGDWFISYKNGIVDNGRRRVAEIAFLNEYGVPRNDNQGARGYLIKSMNEGMAKAIDPLLDIFEDYIADSLVQIV